MSPVRILVAPLRRKAKNSEILISKRSQDFLVIGGNVKKVAQGGSVGLILAVNYNTLIYYANLEI